MVGWRAGRVRAALAALILSATASAQAQSVSIDEKAVAPTPSSTTPSPALPPPTPPVVSPPLALSTPLSYPENATGEADVVLVLTIAEDGSVSAASVSQGAAPFAERALEATKAWRFQAATRDGKNIASKIRFLLHFTPPSAEPAEPPQASRSGPESSAAPPKPTQKENSGNTGATYEVLVVGKREPLSQRLGRAEIHDMPGAFGDPYRAIESLPGVVPIVSGLPYFYVRGAPPGNVGYYFDGVPVPYLYHFAAGPGVLHPAFVDHVDLYPAAYPARYGRFAGAIVAGEMAEPGYRFRGEASIRQIDSGAMLEAPFADRRGSIMLGGRYSYTGFVLSLLVPEITLNYWDYQARVRYQVAARDKLELLVFGAGDFLSQRETVYDSAPLLGTGAQSAPTTRENTVVDVGFHRLDVRWDHDIEHGNWRNALLLGRDRTGADNGSVQVRDYLAGVRSELDQRLSPDLELRAGADLLFESLSQQVNTRSSDSSTSGSTSDGSASGLDPPADPAPMSTSTQPDFGFDHARRDLSAGVRADLVWKAAPRLQVTPGLRLDLYVSGDRTALGVDPRISARYALTDKLEVTHGLALAHQAPSFVVPIPGLKPSLAGGLQSAVQHSAGLSYKLPRDFQASLTLFQNAFFNMTDIISLAELQQTAHGANGGDLQNLRTGGHALGVEAMLKRSLSRDLGGFLAYTLSRSVRSSGRLEGPATTDRTHVLNLGVSYNLGRNWRLGGRWLFYSGIPSKVAYLEAAKAPPRTPAFWRLDVKLQKRWYIVPNRMWWGVVFEVLNTTLNKESLNGDCNAFTCKYESIGPVTIPSAGVEGAF